MTRHKKLSRFSIAATAMVFAAIPCLAQTQHDEAGAATTGPATIVQPSLAMNREMAPKKLITSINADETVMRAAQPTLSPAMFKQSPERFSGASYGFAMSQKFTCEPRADVTMKQSSNEDARGSRPLITFVPSRGQKLPS